MKLVKYYVEGTSVASIYRERDYYTLWFGTVSDGVLTHSPKDAFLTLGAALPAAERLAKSSTEADRDEVTALLEISSESEAA